MLHCCVHTAARQREIKKNKVERGYIRETYSRSAQSTSLKAELESLIKVEQRTELTKPQRLRKKVLMQAFELAVRREKEDEFKKRAAERDGKAMEGLSSVPLPKPPPLPAGPKPEHGPPLPHGAPPGERTLLCM